MSTATQVRSTPRGDSLLGGVAVMLVLNVVQRGVGFARGLLFCRILAEDALGLFSLSNGFLLLAAPLVVLGLPGSFGRYVEYYRERSQLRSYLVQMTVFTIVLTGFGTLVMSLFGSQLAELVLGDASAARLMKYSLASLAAVVAFNFLNELLTALRQVRAVSWMQFVNSLAFTIFGLGLVLLWESSAEAVVLAFGISCVVAMLAVLPWWSEIHAEFSADRMPLEAREFWQRLLPFAGWVWLTNLMANAADMVDRLMLIHYSHLDHQAAQALVGQYHSSRVVPLLLASLAVTIAAIVLPHLSHAWEAGRKREVSAQVNLSLKLIAVAFTVGGLLVLWGSPLLFDWLLAGKYSDGLAALPWALVGCIWFGLFAIAQNYLWCAEHARLGTLALAVGLVLNVLLNLIAIPFGLSAIMAARATATLASVILVLGFNWKFGQRLGRGLWVAMLAPLVIVTGPALGSVLLIALMVLDWRVKWLFDAEEEQQIQTVIGRGIAKLRDRFPV
jgi:O-antigen/teichoic acid export membrane protein